MIEEVNEDAKKKNNLKVQYVLLQQRAAKYFWDR